MRCLWGFPGYFKEESYLREYLTESPLVRFLRAAVLLGAMISIPGVAVCWNLLPKQHSEPESLAEVLPADEPVTEESEAFDDDDSLPSLPPPVLQATPIWMEHGPVPELNPATENDSLSLFSTSGGSAGVINQEMESQARAVPLPSSFDALNTSTVSGAAVAPQRSFPLLESELQALGASRYRLEKWGNRSELFRFSCYVVSPEPYNYQKMFQEIDSDEIRVVERVIADIKSWKGGKGQGIGNRN